eukprot:TRINITY_DN6059_c0_g2_i1.p1 TRINITY_DN6059_c0_g2~~TRINITY_DN6059_c0_g2_i1.p1  ORF type:complete len:340 (+),score=104.55 TRINITY_DN6059_c0_g2_i1:36-1055(+)
MGERKVLNKYYPPEYDHSLLGRCKSLKDDIHNGIKVRMAMPMSVRCNPCGRYIYKGTKFNSRKETVAGEEYLGVIEVFRLYMRCPRCATEFTIKTDPARSDYTAEMNCSRNFEGWRERVESVEEAKMSRQKEEENDAMKALENRTLDSKIERDILDALEEIKALNSKTAGFNKAKLLELFTENCIKKSNQLTEEDEKELDSIVFRNENSNKYQMVDLLDGVILEEEVEEEQVEEEKTKKEKRSNNIIMYYDFEGGESGGGTINEEGNRKKLKATTVSLNHEEEKSVEAKNREATAKTAEKEINGFKMSFDSGFFNNHSKPTKPPPKVLTKPKQPIKLAT